MAVRPIVNAFWDDNVEQFLARRSDDVLDTDDISDIVADLWDTYRYHLPRIGGLAANQIGHMKRIMIVTDNDRNSYLCINPAYVIDEDSVPRLGWEGCFSLPDNLYMVERPNAIRVDYQDRNSKEYKDQLRTGWSARCFLHELDHLDGILIADHAKQHVIMSGAGK